MRLLAACLLAASGGLARQRLPDGSAPLSPLPDSSEPHQRQSRAFPLPPSRAGDSSPVSLSRCRVMASRPRVRVPSLSLSLASYFSLSVVSSRHIPMFSIGYLPFARSHRVSSLLYTSTADLPLSSIALRSLSPRRSQSSVISLASTPPDNSAFSFHILSRHHAFPLSLCSGVLPPRARVSSLSVALAPVRYLFSLPCPPASMVLPRRSLSRYPRYSCCLAHP